LASIIGTTADMMDMTRKAACGLSAATAVLLGWSSSVLSRARDFAAIGAV
jgi:hypothetical protein